VSNQEAYQEVCEDNDVNEFRKDEMKSLPLNPLAEKYQPSCQSQLVEVSLLKPSPNNGLLKTAQCEVVEEDYCANQEFVVLWKNTSRIVNVN